MDTCDRCGAALASSPWCPVCLTRQPKVAPEDLVGELQETLRPGPGMSIPDRPVRVREYSRTKAGATSVGGAAQIATTVLVVLFLLWRSVITAADGNPLLFVEIGIYWFAGVALLRWLWRRRRVL